MRSQAGTIAHALLAAATLAAAAGGCASGRPVQVTAMPGFIVERADHGAAALEGSASGAERRWRPSNFWDALADFDFDGATRHAVIAYLDGDPVGEEQRRLVEAIRLAASGRDGEAVDSALMATIHESTDPLVRRAARIALTATLQSRGDWTALAALSSPATTPVVVAAHSAAPATESAATASAVPAAAAPGAAAPASPAVTSDVPSYAAHDDSATASAVAAERDGRSSVESWARAFRAVPGIRVDFPADPAVVPLTQSRTGIPTVPVRINGRVFLFWLDTGSSLTILADHVAAAAGVVALGSDTLEAVTATGQVRARPAVVPVMELGGVTIANASAMLVSDSELTLGAGDSARVVVDGIIGFDAIRRMDLELDWTTGRATVRRPSPDSTAERTRNLFWLGYPVVRLVTADGTRLHFALDTGADESYAAIPLLRKTGVKTVLGERQSVLGFGKALKVQGRVIPKLRVRLRETPIRLERVFVYVTQYPTIFALDGTLGGDAGRGGVVRIDMTNGVFEVKKSRK